MSLQKQAKTLSKTQIQFVSEFLLSGRNGIRNHTIFLLSVKAGLRAKEIASLKWLYVLDANGELDTHINLPNIASKGKSGRVIPIHPDLRESLVKLYESSLRDGVLGSEYVVTTERSPNTSPQAIVNLFHNLYKRLGLVGCSSHSGRRTFITNISRNISKVGGSMRDVQYLSGHSSLQTTQRYIEGDSQSRVKVVGLL